MFQCELMLWLKNIWVVLIVSLITWRQPMLLLLYVRDVIAHIMGYILIQNTSICQKNSIGWAGAQICDINLI